MSPVDTGVFHVPFGQVAMEHHEVDFPLATQMICKAQVQNHQSQCDVRPCSILFKQIFGSGRLVWENHFEGQYPEQTALYIRLMCLPISVKLTEILLPVRQTSPVYTKPLSTVKHWNKTKVQTWDKRRTARKALLVQGLRPALSSRISLSLRRSASLSWAW